MSIPSLVVVFTIHDKRPADGYRLAVKAKRSPLMSTSAAHWIWRTTFLAGAGSSVISKETEALEGPDRCRAGWEDRDYTHQSTQ